MDIAGINKIATRKRMSADVEKLRDKISKENKKIIKLKVAQDTAYWDLKEKLRQVETNHEKLQQNMLEVQMQYETVSGQYQDELRHRAETLNKLASTREICSVLEDYSERLRDTLARCKADQAALYEAYQQSGQLLRDLKTQQIQQGEKSRQTIESLEEKLKLTTDHHTQLLQYFNEEKQRSATELQEEKKKLNAVLGKNNELLAANTELGALVDHSRRELEKKEESIQTLQRNIKQCIQEFNSQASEMKNSMLKQEKELKEATASNESLKQALHNQEAFTKTVCDQNNQLQEKLALLEEEQTKSLNIVQELKAQLQEVGQVKEQLQNEVTALKEKNSALDMDIFNKNEVIANLEIELQRLTDQIAALDLEKTEVISALEKAGVEAQALVTKVQELSDTGVLMEKRIEEIEDAMKASKITADEKIKELTTTIEEKNKDLDSKASSISQLMDEIKKMSDTRSNLENILQKVRQDLVHEKDAAGEMEKRMTMRVEQLEAIVRNKEVELSKNLSVIMDLRADKERLTDKIESMQIKIDNIQKEITRPAITQPRIEPEQDDNAVMLTPGRQPRNQVPQNMSMDPPPPRKEPKNDSLLFNFLSDNSMDGDKTIDANLVNRHFEAMSRGERLSPVLSGLKRRRNAGVPSSQGGLRHKQTARSQAKDEEANLVNRHFEAMSRGERLSPVLSGLKRRRNAGVPSSQGGLRHKQTARSQAKDEETTRQVLRWLLLDGGGYRSKWSGLSGRSVEDQQTQGTGGGPAHIRPLTDTEARVLEITGAAAVDGFAALETPLVPPPQPPQRAHSPTAEIEDDLTPAPAHATSQRFVPGTSRPSPSRPALGAGRPYPARPAPPTFDVRSAAAEGEPFAQA
ncbi:hypothetical protein NE865_12721 [Phthorimaea operculella]|nr:hypothetical protein NE865_12721 [Phthorimaea operculella]